MDSLDGTQDFLDKTGEFAVMIGLSEKGKAVFGFVYMPTEDKLYYAEKGKGAFVQKGGSDPHAIHVSSQSDIKKAKLVVSRSHISKRIEEAAEKLNVGKMVKCGSNGVKMSLIAEGKADLFFNPTDKLGQWDCCAPHIIVEEAGGMVTGIRGEDIIYNEKSEKNPFGLAVSNGKLHNRVITVFEQ